MHQIYIYIYMCRKIKRKNTPKSHEEDVNNEYEILFAGFLSSSNNYIIRLFFFFLSFFKQLRINKIYC